MSQVNFWRCSRPPSRSCTARRGAGTVKQDKTTCASSSTQSRRSRPRRQPTAEPADKSPGTRFRRSRARLAGTSLPAALSGTRRGSEHRDNPARLSPYKQHRFYFSIASVCRAVADKLASKINYFTVSAAAPSCLVLWAARGRLGNAFCRALAWELRESLSSSLPFQRVIRVKAHTNRNQNT